MKTNLRSSQPRHYFVVFIVGMLFTASILIPIQASYAPEQNSHQLNLTKDQINTIVFNKMDLLQKNHYSIHDIHPYFSKETHTAPLFHIVTLKPNGFMIITNNLYLPPVLAYSFTSYFDIDSNYYKKYTEFIEVDITQRLFEHIQYHNNYRYDDEWQHILYETILSQGNFSYEQWPPKDYSSTDGWIETQWDQQSPFNDFSPIDLTSGDRGLAGCPAVAIAQILNYHQTINDVFFNDSDDYLHNYGQRFWIDNDFEKYGFPSWPQLNTYLESVSFNFKHNIPLTDVDKASLLFACGSAATQVYTPQVSGTFGVSQAFEAYEKFNCDQIELLTFEDENLFDRIIQNIKIGLPVHLAVVTPAWSAGHNLIIDGYNTLDYYHLNFGWNGYFDGWYVFPDDLPYDLTVIEGVIVDILKSTNPADLVASGSIRLIDVAPGSQVQGQFTIRNNGDPGSNLCWEIASYPEWGNWNFSQESGTALTPELGEISINVTIEIPSRKATTYAGGIKIINSNCSANFGVVPLSITTPLQKQRTIFLFLMNRLQQKHPFLSKLVNRI